MWKEYAWTCAYGIAAGVLLVAVCLLYGFDLTWFSIHMLESILKRPLMKWSRRTRRRYRYPGREMLEGLTGNTRNIQPMQLSSYCTLYHYTSVPFSYVQQSYTEGMVDGEYEDTDDASSVSTARSARKAAFSSTMTGTRVDEGHVGVPVRCKIMLQNSEIRVYELLPSHRNAGDTDSLLRGDAEHYRGPIDISLIEAHRKKPLAKHSKGNNVPANRRIFLTSKDGGSLFNSSGRRGDANGNLENNSICGMSGVGSTLGSSEGLGFPSVGSGDQINNNFRDRFAATNVLTSNALAGVDTSTNLVSWNAVMIEFSLPMEADKWLTVIEGLSEAESWREFVREMPNPDTFNLLVCRLFYPSIRRGGLEKLIREMIRKKLVEVAKKKFPRFISGGIELDDFIIGTSFPWISDVSAPVMSTNGEIGFDMNLLYKGDAGGFVLFFKTALAYRGIRIPHFIVSIKLLELQATLHISIGRPPSKKVWVGIHRPPVIRVKAQLGCASGKGFLHRVLNSLPDMSGIICNAIRLYLFSEMILPQMDDFPLPSVEETPPNSPAHTKPKGEKGKKFDRVRAAQQSGRSASPEVTMVLNSVDTLQMSSLATFPLSDNFAMGSSLQSEVELSNPPAATTTPIDRESHCASPPVTGVDSPLLKSPAKQSAPLSSGPKKFSTSEESGGVRGGGKTASIPSSSFFSFSFLCEDNKNVVGKQTLPFTSAGNGSEEADKVSPNELEPEEDLEDGISICSSSKRRPTAFHLGHFVQRRSASLPQGSLRGGVSQSKVDGDFHTSDSPRRRSVSQFKSPQQSRFNTDGSFASDLQRDRADMESFQRSRGSNASGSKEKKKEDTGSNESNSTTGVSQSTLRQAHHRTPDAVADIERGGVIAQEVSCAEVGVKGSGQPSASASVPPVGSTSRSKAQSVHSGRGATSRGSGSHIGMLKHQGKEKTIADILRDESNSMNQPAVSRIGDTSQHFGYAYGLRHRLGGSSDFSDDDSAAHKVFVPAHSCFCRSGK